MSTLDQALDDYLRLHRSLGRKYVDHGIQLPQFVAYLDAAGATTVTTELALAWAIQPTDATPVWWARRLGMAMVHDAERGVYAVGPESLGGHALLSADAPELVLPTLEGEEFRLSSLRGQKVVLVAWAPY